MAQVKVYGLKEHLNEVKKVLSEIIHECLVEALEVPQDKRFQRFFPLEAEDFFYPPGRTERYTIIEMSMFEGRSVEAKKKLIGLLYERLEQLGIPKDDLEITIFETPRHNWGIRGLPGDELVLAYEVMV